jgi:alkylhydroperoxidase family enzyme
MPSTFRIPATSATGPWGRLTEAWTRRTFGQVPDGVYVYWHHRRVLRDVLGFERRVQRWRSLDPNLQAYAQMATAAAVGCSWCLDFGYFMAHHDGLDERKAREVPRWRDSEVFTPVERDVLEYAEAMSATPPTVDDALSRRLQEELGVPAVVELTQLVALENMRARFNSAAGLEDQGFSAACDLPLAVPSGP